MKRNYPSNPSLQPIKGIFIFEKGDEFADRALDLLKSLHCEVMTSHENRMTVKTSRGNLQTIKQSWLAKNEDTPLNKELNACVLQIIIGGKV